MNDRQIRLGSVLAYTQMAMSILVGLVYTPMMIKLLGQSEYGLYNTVASTVSMLSILNLGFSSSYIKYFSKYKKESDYNSIYKLNGLFMIIFIIIGVIAFLCGWFLTNNLELVFDTGLTVEELKIARTLMLLLTVNLAISFPMSVFSNIISANEKFIFLKSIGILKTVATPLITIPLLLLGRGSIAIVLVTLIISIIVDIVNITYVIVKLGNRFVFYGFEKNIFISLFTYTAFIAINIIIDQINWNIDKVLLGRYKGTLSVAVYSVGATLQTYYQMFSTSVSSLFTPKVHAIVNSNNNVDKYTVLSILFIKVGRIQFFILGLVCTELIFFGREFIYYWAGKNYENAYYVALLLIIPVTVPLIQNIGIEIQRAMDKHGFRSLAYAIMALVNLILSISLCKRYGEIGVAIGTTISLIVSNGIIINIYYQKACGIDIICFWKNIIQMSKGLVLPVIVAIMAKSIINFYNVFMLIIGIIIYALVYVIAFWRFGLNNEEKKLINGIIEKIYKKKI